MREVYKGVTPQAKLVAVNQKFGNTGIKSQQGTTRLIYDTLPITVNSANTFRFFEDSASRNFPFSNTGSDGNKLGVGDTMTISSITFFLLRYDAVNLRWDAMQQISSNQIFSTGTIDFEIANNRVIKNLSLLESRPEFDKNVGAPTDTTIEMDTEIVIPPLLNYICQLRTSYISAANLGVYTHIRCVINGAGGIIAPRTTF
jgi:hypothetical protein